jgi:hypothetical protein
MRLLKRYNLLTLSPVYSIDTAKAMSCVEALYVLAKNQRIVNRGIVLMHVLAGMMMMRRIMMMKRVMMMMMMMMMMIMMMMMMMMMTMKKMSMWRIMLMMMM